MHEEPLLTSNMRSTFVQVDDPNSNPNSNPNPVKKRRSLPGTPDPDAEVIALSPKSLMATNRFICEICKRGFQRDQNLQLHQRGHNLPWKLKQRTKQDVKKKVYVCPEDSCVHHDPCRALGDLTGIKKHYSRKHGEKKWKCNKCSKKYAVLSDWKAHSKICGTREHKCECGTLFSRRDSFMTHRTFCGALAERSARITSVPAVLCNFRNDHSMNTEAPRIPQRLSGFHKEFGRSGPEPLMGNFVDAEHGQKLRMPPWLEQANSNVWISSGANELFQTMNMFGSSPQAQCLINYRYPESSFTSANLSLPLPAAMPQGLKQEQEENKGDLSHSVSSLYSSNQNIQGGPTHMLSANENPLIQKATQMESTRLNDNATFNDSNNNVFDLLNSNLSCTSSINNRNNNIVEPQKIFKQGNREKFNDMVVDNMVMAVNEEQLGLTRDFLGVGGHETFISRAFLQQDLAKFNFNPIGSVVDLQSHGYI